MEGGIRLVPGTDFDAGATAGTPLIPYPHSGTSFLVYRPFLIAVMHLLIAVAYSPAGTFAGAFLAFGAEILEPEIDGFVGKQGKVSSDHGCLETGTEKGMEHNVSDPAHLTQSGQQDDRRHVDTVEGGIVGLGRIAQSPDVLREDDG